MQGYQIFVFEPLKKNGQLINDKSVEAVLAATKKGSPKLFKVYLLRMDQRIDTVLGASK